MIGLRKYSWYSILIPLIIFFQNFNPSKVFVNLYTKKMMTRATAYRPMFSRNTTLCSTASHQRADKPLLIEFRKPEKTSANNLAMYLSQEPPCLKPLVFNAILNKTFLYKNMHLHLKNNTACKQNFFDNQGQKTNTDTPLLL